MKSAMLQQRVLSLAVAGLLAAAVPPAALWAQEGAPRQVSVAVRDHYLLNIPDALERIEVVDPEVADVLLQPARDERAGAVLVVGRKPGTTMVSVWRRGHGQPQQYVVTVTGDLATLLPEPDGARARIYGDSAVLAGQAPSMMSHQRSLAAAADAVGRDKVVDASVLAGGSTVQVEVKVVEFNRQTLKDAGFDWSAAYRRGSFTFASGSTLAPTANRMFEFGVGRSGGNFVWDVNLRLLESNGLARVLAEPTLVALSGQSARFLAGGELPVPQASGLGTTSISYKPFGIGLTVTPTILAPNRIALKVAPEASDLDWVNGVTVNGTLLPAIITRRADTTVELGDGESFVIGGLVSRSTTSNVDKVPLLGDLPVIGTFFRNLSYSQREKELLIVVTPRVVRAMAKGTEVPLPGEGRERPDRGANAWGHFLLGVASRDDLPGFSK